MVTKSICFRYISHEKETEGFYPYISKGDAEIIVEFIFEDGCWKQNTEQPIDEFDQETRVDVLKLLNDDTHSSKIILDPLGYLI